MEDSFRFHSCSVEKEAVSLDCLGEFVTSLIQAFLRTGYYLAEHPEAKRAKSGLYERFLLLTGESGEICFLLKEEHGHKLISIEGLSPEPIRLATIMSKGMSETYNPRFVQYMDRKELVSLSLKTRMGGEEFSRFIDLMSEPQMIDMRGRAAKDKFEAGLRGRGICNISFVFNEDFIILRPGIPWRVGMALSRLRKDLRMAPLFRELSAAELHRIREEILHDILRPINDVELIYAFLMNIDLAVTAELSEEQGEDALLVTIREVRVPPLAGWFIRDASGETELFLNLVAPEKIARISRKISSRLFHSTLPEARVKLKEMFRCGLITQQELPPEVREQIVSERLAADFKAHRDAYLSRFDAIRGEEGYLARLKELSRIILTFLEEGEYGDALVICETVSAHGKEQTARGRLAEKMISWLGKHPLQEKLADNFLCASKADRIVLGRLSLLFGAESSPRLIRIVRETDDPWRCKQAADCILQIGEDAPLLLVEELERGKLSPEKTAVIIHALREVTGQKVTKAYLHAIRDRVNDLHLEVRREALQSICRLDPQGNFPLFSTLADDPDAKTRRIAFRGLGLSGEISALPFLIGYLDKSGKGKVEFDWELAATAIEALGHLFSSCPGLREKIADFLAGIVERACSVSTWQKLLTTAPVYPAEVLLVVAETLLTINSAAGRKVLARLAGNDDSVIRGRAGELLKKLDRQ